MSKDYLFIELAKSAYALVKDVMLVKSMKT